MFETVLVLLSVMVAIFFYVDIKRKTVAHQNTVTSIKSKLATETNMTSHFAVFSQGPQESILLAASGPHDLFWHYKIAKEKITDQYKVPLHSITRVQVLVNNAPVEVTATSGQPSATLRAAEVARQEVQRMGERVKRVKRVTMTLEYQTEEDTQRQQIPLYQALDNDKNPMVIKILLNSIWWQQYLREFIGKKIISTIDTP